MANYFNEKMNLYKNNIDEMSLKIKNWTTQYSYTSMSNNYLDFYKKILKKN